MRIRRLVIGTLLLAACHGGKSGSGRLDVMLTSTTDTVRFKVRARAHWCASDSSLEIVGTRGDSGLAVALFPKDSLLPGAYPVGAPDHAVIVRPSARVGARWFGKTLVEGFYSVSGVVNLSAGGTVSGDLVAMLQGVGTEGQEEARGTFRNVPVRAAELPCGSRPDTTEGPSRLREG